MKTEKMQLFVMTQPDLVSGLFTRETLANKELPKSDTNGVRAAQLVAESRKAIAKRLGVSNTAENKTAIDAELLKAQDQLMKLAVTEMSKRALSGEWTGKAVRVSTNKKNTEQTFTVSLKTCDRIGSLPTKEQVIKYLSTLSEDEQVEVSELAEEVAKGRNAIDLAPNPIPEAAE